jgi:rubrerythrin
MEQRAIDIYGSRAESAEDPQEKALYRWLADWERSHLKLLSDLDRELTESIWYDNNFWPM